MKFNYLMDKSYFYKKNEISNSLVAAKIFSSFARFDDDGNLKYMDLAK